MITALRICFSSLLLVILAVIVATSLESNLFTEFPDLLRIPWMRATLWDFYALLAPLLFWMWYREPSVAGRVGWTLAFVLLGSIGTSSYILARLFSVDRNAGIGELLLRREGK